jgi:hypothetical protein
VFYFGASSNVKQAQSANEIGFESAKGLKLKPSQILQARSVIDNVWFVRTNGSRQGLVLQDISVYEPQLGQA